MTKVHALLSDALSLHQNGNLSRARSQYQRALRLDPRNVDGRYLLAMLECQDGRFAIAVPALKRLAAELPKHGEIHFTLGRALQEVGNATAALDAFAVAMMCSPSNAEAFLQAARSYGALRNWNAACQVLEKGIAFHPADPMLWNALGITAGAEKRNDDALAALQRATQLNPGEPEFRYNLGRGLRQSNRTNEAAEQLAHALQLDPGFARAGMLLARLLPVVYDTAGEVMEWRNKIRDAIETLPTSAPKDPSALAAVFEAIADTSNFFLAYQGCDDRAIAERWGQFVQTIVAARYPHLTQSPKRRRRPGQRIRVGFYSAHLRDHTVLYLFRSWLTGLDRAKFQVSVYGVGEGDADTRSLAAEVEQYRTLPDNIEETAKIVRADALDVLIFLDIGMDPSGQILGSMRLAPVQATTWGHPVTTGLHAIDWFLSSDAMEPVGAEAHYSERLHRLPGLAVSVTPAARPAAPMDRARFGVSDGDVVFICTQSLFKLLPQHDDVWPRIAARVPNARFVFLESSATGVVDVFKRRLDRAFAGQRVVADHHVVWLPPLSHDDYLALNMAGDVFLDSMEWSGGRTTLEAVSCGLVPITTPGTFMRGRHTAGILSELDLPELIAPDKTALVDLAVRLAHDPLWREHLRRHLLERSASLFADARWRPALETWIESVVA